MNVSEARDLVLELMLSHPQEEGLVGVVNPASPDGDAGKFSVAGEPARVIHHFSGWHVPIELSWFTGSFEQPEVNGGKFHWYAFAIPHFARYRADHYFLCDFLQMREWVLDFSAPLGNAYRDQKYWRADLQLYSDPKTERTGYFRWGDETPGVDDKPHRVFSIDNVATVVEPPPVGAHVGTFGPGGESAAHKLLKLYVAAHPDLLGLSPGATSHVEYLFATGDCVDVLVENHLPDRTVVEVEVDGQQHVCVGILQAIKYRTLAAVDAGYPLLTSRVRSFVAAYDTHYPPAEKLAERYEVSLLSVPKEDVLATAV